MLAEIALPLLAVAALLLSAPASPSPEAAMPPQDDTADDADAATLGGPTDGTDPAAPDSPPPPVGPTSDPVAVPDPAPTDPAPTDPAPTDPAPGPDPALPAGPKKVVPKDVLAATAVDRDANADLKRRMAELSASLAESDAKVAADDRRISALTRNAPDGILTTGPDGKPAVYAFSTAAPGYYVTHPATDDTPVDDPDAMS